MEGNVINHTYKRMLISFFIYALVFIVPIGIYFNTSAITLFGTVKMDCMIAFFYLMYVMKFLQTQVYQQIIQYKELRDSDALSKSDKFKIKAELATIALASLLSGIIMILGVVLALWFPESLPAYVSVLGFMFLSGVTTYFSSGIFTNVQILYIEEIRALEERGYEGKDLIRKMEEGKY